MRWQLSQLMLALAIFAVGLPAWYAIQLWDNDDSAIIETTKTDESNGRALARHIGRANLALAIERMQQLHRHIQQTENRLRSTFGSLQTDRNGRQIAAAESTQLRFRALHREFKTEAADEISVKPVETAAVEMRSKRLNFESIGIHHARIDEVADQLKRRFRKLRAIALVLTTLQAESQSQEPAELPLAESLVRFEKSQRKRSMDDVNSEFLVAIAELSSRIEKLQSELQPLRNANEALMADLAELAEAEPLSPFPRLDDNIDK